MSLLDGFNYNAKGRATTDTKCLKEILVLECVGDVEFSISRDDFVLKYIIDAESMARRGESGPCPPP
jgi:hypothetical protein